LRVELFAYGGEPSLWGRLCYSKNTFLWETFEVSVW